MRQLSQIYNKSTIFKFWIWNKIIRRNAKSYNQPFSNWNSTLL